MLKKLNRLQEIIFSLEGQTDTPIFQQMSTQPGAQKAPHTKKTTDPKPADSNLYKYMLDRLTDFIALCDADYTIETANRSAEVILGGGLSLNGQKCYEKYRGKTDVCDDCPLQETLESGKISSVEYYDNRFGAYFEERTHPILGEDGQLTGFVLVGRNITHTREMSDKSIQSKKLAALGQISSGVAHDFNNVLTGILGRLQLLKRITDDPELLKNFAVMETAALDGAATVKRMQDFARIREETELESVNMKALLDEVATLTRPRWRDGPRTMGTLIEMKLELAEDAFILGAAYDLRRAFTNLIFNAVDAMPDGGVISLSSNKHNDQLIIKVRDTGLGMTEETTEHIFDPFFTTKGVKGTGLGLSEVYGVCKRHGGEISVSSTPGQGTEFTLHFPLAEKGISLPRIEQKFVEAHPARIMVIDDEKYVLDIVDEVLTEHRHEVIPYTSAQQALQALKKAPCDVVITDLGMPEMSGWEVARYVKLENPKLPVILLTGWSLEMDPDQIQENGVDYVLQKPFSMADLEQIVAMATQKSKSPHTD